MEEKPFWFLETYATCLPSGDQMGASSGSIVLVTALPLPVATSNVQISVWLVLESARETTTRVPSGERLASPYLPGSPTLFRILPWRSNTVICGSLSTGGAATTNRSPSRLTLVLPSATPTASGRRNRSLGLPYSNAG